jgi:hypothetical protein
MPELIHFPSEIERRISSNIAEYSKAFSLITLIDTLAFVFYIELPKHIIPNAFVINSISSSGRSFSPGANSTHERRLAILRIAALHGENTHRKASLMHELLKEQRILLTIHFF